MIKSILDTDLYKFSTSYAYFHLYPNAEGTFTFTDRNKESIPKQCQAEFMDRFWKAIIDASRLHLGYVEMKYCINNIPYIPATYWEWLSSFQFDIEKINACFDKKGVFQCEVTDKLYKVTLYEILVLAVVSEIRNELSGYEVDLQRVRDLTIKKVEYANEYQIFFSEFGTRRRFSSVVQEVVLTAIKDYSETCLGTSNVYYAMQYGMKPIGTFPHEWVMFHAACFGYKRANYLSLEDWIDVYRGDLGIALVDTYTTKSFLHTLTKQQAMLLSGFRQDSGDEVEVGNRILARLSELGINTDKTIVFSNSLNFEKAKKINDIFKGHCKPSFGIGTNLTSDIGVEGYKPANIVMKLSRCRLSSKDNWESCLKISDDQGKHMGPEEEYKLACKELCLNV